MGEGIVVEDDLGVDVLVGGLEIERARDAELAVYARVRCHDSCALRFNVLHGEHQTASEILYSGGVRGRNLHLRGQACSPNGS